VSHCERTHVHSGLWPDLVRLDVHYLALESDEIVYRFKGGKFHMLKNYQGQDSIPRHVTSQVETIALDHAARATGNAHYQVNHFLNTRL
jgi:hypothetical protein